MWNKKGLHILKGVEAEIPGDEPVPPVNPVFDTDYGPFFRIPAFFRDQQSTEGLAQGIQGLHYFQVIGFRGFLSPAYPRASGNPEMTAFNHPFLAVPGTKAMVRAELFEEKAGIGLVVEDPDGLLPLSEPVNRQVPDAIPVRKTKKSIGRADVLLGPVVNGKVLFDGNCFNCCICNW